MVQRTKSLATVARTESFNFPQFWELKASISMVHFQQYWELKASISTVHFLQHWKLKASISTVHFQQHWELKASISTVNFPTALRTESFNFYSTFFSSTERRKFQILAALRTESFIFPQRWEISLHSQRSPHSCLLAAASWSFSVFSNPTTWQPSPQLLWPGSILQAEGRYSQACWFLTLHLG